MNKFHLNLLLTFTFCISTPLLWAQTDANIQKKLATKIEQNKVFAQIFTGFSLYDPTTKESIYEKDANKYFTPASNTKILTFYVATQLLGDNLPLAHYMTDGDSLIIWGTGNPQFLNPDLPQDSSFWTFLKNPDYKIYFSDHNYLDSHYGAGWAWDDFDTSYQPEKSPFPIYGNTARFDWDGKDIMVTPSHFHKHILPNPVQPSSTVITRDICQNLFVYKPWITKRSAFKETIPFAHSADLLTQLLSDTLGKPVQYLSFEQLPRQSRQTFSIPMPDSLYTVLMQDSDNFIAEQLLLMCSDKVFGVQNTDKIIDYAKDVLFDDLPDKPVWRDGSGLSRYNLFTPRSIVHILNKLHQSIPEERLLKIFPAGGESGTIEKWYGSRGKPYVFAKTGTLSNKHCLSGYIRTESGRLLIFSFMHNNYIGSADPVKEEMEDILAWIHREF